MAKLLFSFLLVFHGLIHLIGFAKAFQIAKISEITQNISRPVGVLWLISFLLFITTATLFLFKNNLWWLLAILAVILSQTLVIMYWQDTKYGSIPNIIILVIAIIGYGIWNFNSTTQNELKSLLPSTNYKTLYITKETISKLPPIVQKWLERSNIVGKNYIKSIYLEQKGKMRITPEGNWMDVTAKQWFNTENPGFIWIAKVKMFPGAYFAGRDKYENGKGHMLIKLLYLIPVVDEKGREIDQGTLLRYLGEIVWFPTAALSKYIKWEQIDKKIAKATISHGKITATGIFEFNENGDLISFQARRYYNRKGKNTLENWYVRIEPDSYKEFENVRIPTVFSVTWKLKEGDFTWYKFEVTNVKYNLPPK
ncbi:hypothetical protein JYK00_06970 [Thermosipho ferrireducens]|uniref:DUF4131 domain-containing protein n=1 Tax=Thermosipho ferrireducens TaxID=2571116 RepID=A0ABX7S862_9BACT|nr:DUF6544 family protein [Thermosipho ferrireducens]QTA37473.1 hypothetical protein JYK00_06970 [Thermosipho ferrireducens]